MELKSIVIVFVVGAVAGAAITYKLTAKGETIKTIEVTKDHIVTVTKTVKEPSGQETTETTQTQDIIEAQKITDVKMPPQPQWLLGASYSPSFSVAGGTYSGTIGRRILGPVFLTVEASTAGNVSAGLLVEF